MGRQSQGEKLYTRNGKCTYLYCFDCVFDLKETALWGKRVHSSVIPGSNRGGCGKKYEV